MGSAEVGGGPVVVRRIGEYLQRDDELLKELRARGVVPGRRVTVAEHGMGGVLVDADSGSTALTAPESRSLFVSG